MAQEDRAETQLAIEMDQTEPKCSRQRHRTDHRSSPPKRRILSRKRSISRSWWRCSIRIRRYMDRNKNQNQTLDQGRPPALRAVNRQNLCFGCPKQGRLCCGQQFDALTYREEGYRLSENQQMKSISLSFPFLMNTSMYQSHPLRNMVVFFLIHTRYVEKIGNLQHWR